MVLIEFHSQVLGLHNLLKTIQQLWEVVLCSNVLLFFLNQPTIAFEIFEENITTADINCTTNISTPIRTCNIIIDNHLVSLTCDYSTGYQINCTLSVDSVTRSSEVFCRVLNQSTVEAMERAAVLVVDGMESSKGIVTWEIH